MIDLAVVDTQVWRVGGVLVRHGDRIATGHHRAGQGDGAQDPGYWNMAIEGAGGVEFEETAVQAAVNSDEWQSCRGDAGTDWFGVTQREQGQRFVAALQTFERDDRVFPATHRHTSAPR